MSPRKLTQDDKQDILRLYRGTEETTSTLANRFGVSSSTISRFLKNNLSAEEYEELIQQKRLGRTGARTETFAPETSDLEEKATSSRIRKRSAKPALSEESTKILPEDSTASVPSPKIENTDTENTDEDEPSSSEDYDDEGERTAIEEMFGEDIDDSDEDEENLDEEDWEDEEEQRPITPRGENVDVLPLGQATLPRICYLVIDRSAELITRPLKDFGDLGKIPDEEVRQKTLPIFEHHKVARRFSNRSQRVIKVPDSRMLQKVGTYLQAKGITRLLIDGQIYSVLPLEDQ